MSVCMHSMKMRKLWNKWIEFGRKHPNIPFTLRAIGSALLVIGFWLLFSELGVHA